MAIEYRFGTERAQTDVKTRERIAELQKSVMRPPREVAAMEDPDPLWPTSEEPLVEMFRRWLGL